MKVVRWKLRECSVRLRRCALTGRGSAARAERGVLADTRDVKDCDKIPVKVESEGEDAVFHPVLNTEPGNLWKDSMTDIILHGKEENDLKRIEDEVVIKQELDIGPTILQPKTMARSFPPITSVFLQPSAPDPRPTTDSTSGAASALACLANIGQPARVSQNEVKDDYCFGDSSVTPDSTFVLDVTNSEDSYQRVLCQWSCDCSNSEDRSVQIGGQGAYSVGASSGSDCRADTIKAEPSTHVSDKQDGSRHCKHNTIKELNSMKPTNATHKLLWKEQYEYSASKLCKLSTHTHEELYKCGHHCLKRRMRYRTSKKPYKCERCEFSTSRLSHLQTHIRIHTGEKPYRCEHCNYSASEIGNLKRHMRTHTGEKPYRCEHCNYNSSEISNLKTHMRTHTGEKPYRCEHCNYSSSQKGTLKRHMRTHTGEKPYRCEQCEYSTSEIGTLKKHMRTHTGEKPYKCEHCEYSASKIGTLKRHIRTHTGEKPHKCGQCEYSASQQGLLKIHMHTHTGEKPISADSVSTVHLNKVF